MSESLIFHCSQPILDADGAMVMNKNGKVLKTTPTHTLMFEKRDDNSIIMGWAQVHTKDSYCKKTGRKIATDRIEMINRRLDEYSNRKIHILPNVDKTFLPQHIFDSNFDYYFNRAVSKMFDINKLDNITLYFRSINQDKTVCSVEIKGSAIRSSIKFMNDLAITNAKLLAEKPGDTIFSTITQDNGNVLIHIQNRKDFYENGINDISDEYLNIIKHVNTNKISEKSIITTLSAMGFAYDPNLELELQ